MAVEIRDVSSSEKDSIRSRAVSPGAPFEQTASTFCSCKGVDEELPSQISCIASKSARAENWRGLRRQQSIPAAVMTYPNGVSARAAVEEFSLASARVHERVRVERR